MTGVEFDMVITDSLTALELYEKVFDLQRVEVTSFSKGENEVINIFKGHQRGLYRASASD